MATITTRIEKVEYTLKMSSLELDLIRNSVQTAHKSTIREYGKDSVRTQELEALLKVLREPVLKESPKQEKGLEQ